ncbi:hypothetical protein [Beijerinckia mobilis]|uniref:hypothetical protein n=1 Tax=Beijerinckia mobilis TaxID=231434 RepID=UPI0012EBE70C|nr:hypothetical protein [Beijerinckia mobilis]
MHSRLKSLALTLCASSALASFLAAPVHAQDAAMAAKIEKLEAQLRKLEHQLAVQDRRERATAAEVHKVTVHPVNPREHAGRVGGASPAHNYVPVEFGPDHSLRAPDGTLISTDKIYYKGLTITPGGFFELDGIFRSRNQASDLNTSWGAIPYGNVATGHTNEYRLTERHSRFSLLVEGDINKDIHLGGYVEMDWLGAAQSANLNQTDSFQPRIRNMYATVDFKEYGLHGLFGQSWSLMTLNAHGMSPRKEQPPMVIDAQYVPGFNFARQPQLRLVKDLGKDLFIGVSMENPQTTFGGNDPGNIAYNITGGSGFNNVNKLSLNNIPDFIGKVAWEPVLGDRQIHIEGFGIYRNFYSYNTATGVKSNVTGWGGGGGIIVPAIPKTLDLQFSGFAGRGIGRYGASGLPDVAIQANGTLTANPEVMLLAGAILHATPTLDFYVYAGQEQQLSPRYSFSSNGTPYGIGNPLYNNSGCNIVGSSLCSNQTSSMRSLAAGFWDNFYSGSFGRLQGGVQYSYTQRTGYAGIGGTPKADTSIIMTSLRYYPF